MRTDQLEREYLISLLSSVIHDRQPQNPPVKLDWERLYQLSAGHGVSNMACYGINRLSHEKKPSQEVMSKFQNDCKMALAKEATQHIEVEQVLRSFEENRIACMPLKGYLVKYLYPQPDMRLMADVDILFKREQTRQVKKLLVGLGFAPGPRGENVDAYYKKPFLNVEMHYRLISESSPHSEYLSQVWDRAVQKAGCKSIYQLSHEDFFVYLLIHLTKHYANSGTGIRSLMDIWVYINHYRSELDWNYIQAELEQVKLREFAANICGLGEVWFGTAQRSELHDEMAGYIFSSGVHGTKKQSVRSSLIASASSTRSIGTAKQLYKMKLFFPGRKQMKIQYPFLETLPFLLPLCWVLRGVRCFLFKREHTFHRIKSVDSVSSEEMARIWSLHKKAGLLQRGPDCGSGSLVPIRKLRQLGNRLDFGARR